MVTGGEMDGAAASDKEATDMTTDGENPLSSSASDKTASDKVQMADTILLSSSVDEADDRCHSNFDTQDYSDLDDDDTGDLC